MLSKLAGVGFALLFVSLSYVIFSVTMNNKSSGYTLIIGMLATAIYSLPFIIMGAVISHFVLRNIRSNWLQYLLHAILGAIVALTAVVVYKFYYERSLFIYVLVTGVLGSMLYYLSSKLNRKLQISLCIFALFVFFVVLFFSS